MKVYEIPISRQQLDSIPADERLFFIQIGHLANELSTLNRLLLFASKTTGTTELERWARNSQALLLVRLCSGKLFEGWQMLQRDYFGSKLSKEYDRLLDESGKNSLTEIKRYFSKNNLIKDIRDNFAFHYPSDDLQNQLQRTKNTGTLYIYLGYAHGNSFYSFADVLVGSAMLSKVQGVDPQQAMDALFTEPINATNWFLDFIGSCMIILVEKYLGATLDALGANTVEVSNTKKWEDVQVPFFLADEN
jgi:hypothetical protein